VGDVVNFDLSGARADAPEAVQARGSAESGTR